MKSPFNVSSDLKKCATVHSSWTPCGNYTTFKALLIDLGKNPTPARIDILQLWFFGFFFFLVISWVIFKLLILRGRIWKSVNLFKVKHISISVNHPSNILPAPRLQLSATEKVNEHLQIESRRRASSALQDFTSDTRKGQSLSCDGTCGMSGDRLQGRFCGNYWLRIHRQGAQRSVWQTFLSHIWGKLSTRIWYQIGPAKTTT